MYLIVGLGNPGKQYEKSRHNIGFVVVDKANFNFSRHSGIPLAAGKFPTFKLNKKFKCQISKGDVGGEKLIIAKPQTFMNNSGEVVTAISHFYKIPTHHIIIVHDDLDLPLGEFKIQQNRGAAGHNGVQSVIDRLGTRDFIRIRIGIASSDTAKTGADFVLAKFSKAEMAKLQKTLEQVVEAVKSIVSQGLEKTMTIFNS